MRVQSLERRVRGHESRLGGGVAARRRPPGPRWPRDGSTERTSMSGLARRLSAHGPARLLLVLRGVHPHHRLDVQPAREMAEDDAAHSLAAADRVLKLSADVA